MKLFTFFIFFPCMAVAQSYTSYFTGDTTDVSHQSGPCGGVVLMGGATENDNAMRWFLNRCGKGDVLVIRASGSDGYNDYLYSELGVTVNSVETIVFNNATAASDPYVIQQINHAEAIWIAGGDQWKYISYWKDSPVETALQAHISVKKAVIGGTSAGMAILGEGYFSAQNGTITSAQAQANPFDNKLTLGHGDFLSVPYLTKVITDTHYDAPDRRGRHIAFIARLNQQDSTPWRGIACEEYTAVCIDTAGSARVYGTTGEPDYAWFIQSSCTGNFLPEICAEGQPLHWVNNQMAVKAYQVLGDDFGAKKFNLKDWKTGNGGFWYDWWVDNGVLNAFTPALAPECLSNVNEIPLIQSALIMPNPASTYISILFTDAPGTTSITARLYNLTGSRISEQTIDHQNIRNKQYTFHLPTNIQPGVYFLAMQSASGNMIRQVVIE